MQRYDGFTLLEVMVAILILGISMSSLFSAQATAIAINNHIKYTTVAGELARCKMSELELLFLEEGFQEVEFENWEEGSCCELREERREKEEDQFNCRWKIEKITLPSTEEIQTKATQAYMSSNISDNTSSGTTTDLQGLTAGILSGFLPMIQTLLENAIRKVTVEVQWKVGGKERSFQLVQYITNPAQGELGTILKQGILQESSHPSSSIQRTTSGSPDIVINIDQQR